MRSIYGVVLLMLMTPFISSGFTRHVPAIYPTIQSALNACIQNDTVLVQPGTYLENISWPTATNGIKLISVNGSGQTIISAGGSGRVLAVSSALIDTTTHITGFTFTDGYLSTTSGVGAGVFVANASVCFDDIIVAGNRVFQPGGHGYGAGIYFDNSSSVIRNSSVSGNSIDTASWCYGAGIYISGGNLSLENIYITGNYSNSESWCYGVGLYARANATITLDRVYVAENFSGDNAVWYYGNGVYLGNVTATLTNVLIVNNLSGAGGSFNYGGGLFCDGNAGLFSLMNVTVSGNDKAGSASINGSGIYVRDASVTAVNCIFHNQNSGPESATSLNGSLDITFSNVRGGMAGTGNINVVPGFVSTLDFHLLPASLCAGAGTDVGAPASDLDGTPRPLPAGTMPDMGCYEIDQTATGLITHEIEENSLNVYPNPVISGSLLIVKNAGESLTITDISGRIVFSSNENSGQFEISTEGWDAGWYFVCTSGRRAEKFGVIR